MKITIRIEKNYGIQTAYPSCDSSRLLAKLAGTKTLTWHALETIRALGYAIEIEQTAPWVMQSRSSNQPRKTLPT